MAFRDANANEIPTVTIHSVKLRPKDAATEMQLRSVRHDSYDQFAIIFSSRYLQYPTLPLQFLTSKKSIGPMTLFMCNIDEERCAVLTQSAKVCTHRVRPPPFWLIVTALDRNRYLPAIYIPWWDLDSSCVGITLVLWCTYVYLSRLLWSKGPFKDFS